MRHKYVFLAGCALLVACRGNKPAGDPAPEKQSPPAGQTHHHGHTGIELNKGQKWKVDPDMIRYIRTMERDIHAFHSIEMEDYQTLANRLQENIDGLTSHCTMTGKAHDELHKWLLPFIDSTHTFSACENTADASAKLAELKQSFVLFNKYFE